MMLVKEIDKLCIFFDAVMNVIVLYCLVCIGCSVIIDIFKVLVFLICEELEKIIEKLEIVVIGEKGKKSLKYGCGILWFLKFEADIEYFINWIKYDVIKTYTVIYREYDEGKTKLYWAKLFSLDGLIQWIKRGIRYFFGFRLKNWMIIGFVLYYVFRKGITQFINDYLLKFDLSKVNSENILNTVQIITLVVAFLYIILDVKYKISASFTLREDRFKKLIVLEENLMLIMQEMSYALEKNIEELCNKKSNILSQGATELSGKNCNISKDKIELCDGTKFWVDELNNIDIFENFCDFQKEFEQLKEFSNEYKKSSLNFSNIYLVDCETMLTKVEAFWSIWGNNMNYTDTKFMGKNSMQTWYLNFFSKRVLEINGEKRFYNRTETIRIVYEASSELDFKLKRAFVLELYLRRYERQMSKRLKKINKFSKIHI